MITPRLFYPLLIEILIEILVLRKTMNSSENKTIVTMVGAPRTGKTSLLASMFFRMKEEVRNLECSFTIDASKAKKISDSEVELRDLADIKKGMVVDLDLGARPDTGRTEYDFCLQVKSGIPEINVRFIDLPGGWTTGVINAEEAQKSLRESQVILLAVDSWALMELGGDFNNVINSPRAICNNIESACQKIDVSAPHPLILITLVKSEKYLHRGKAKELYEAAISCYKEPLQPLIDKGYKIAVVAVETVGGIELFSVDARDDGSAIGKFKRLQGAEGGFQPKHCAIPLRFVFQIALNTATTKTKPWWMPEALWAILKDLKGLPTALSSGIGHYQELRKVSERISAQIEKENIQWLK